MRHAVIAAATIVLAAILVAGCAQAPPIRTKIGDPGALACTAVYAQAQWRSDEGRRDPVGETQRIHERIAKDLRDPTVAGCWNASTESHPAFDMFTLEFDDQGWLAGVAKGVDPARSQLVELAGGLERLSAGGHVGQGASPGAGPRPLSIIVYTHGWHHSAAPDDENVIAFRHLLDSAAAVEDRLCREENGASGKQDAAQACADDAPAGKSTKKRRIVGIYLGWRGDSILGPLIEDTSIWDRKNAAETIALGSVQEFYARLHDFFLAHECHLVNDHRSQERTDCKDDVRLLTIGHSFGGLITYRALAPRMMLGVAETTYRPEEIKGQAYAYGFGDLTVLINPAFEATRFEPLAEAAAQRHYITSTSTPGKSAQLPTLIVATSATDWATGYAFPAFRRLSTFLQSTDGPQGEANIETVGWDSRYLTHSLAYAAGPDACGISPDAPLDDRLVAESKWAKRQQDANYRGFNDDTLAFCGGLTLKRETREAWQLSRPDFLPLWVIKADKSVIDGHNDFLNPRFVDFVRQVYYTILRQGDVVMAKPKAN
jgi:hypothetical protein